MEDKMLKQIFPAFRPVIEKALRSEFPGGSIELVKVTANRDCPDNNFTDGHYFTFHLPFAGTMVEWDVLFDTHNAERPPDFVCAEDIDYEPDIYSDLVKSWDLNNHKSLVKLLKKLTIIYKNHQLAHLKNFTKAADACESLIEAGVLKKNIEIKYVPSDRKFNVLVKLNVKDEDLPLIEGLSSTQVYAGLLYSLDVDGNVNSHGLIVSPYLERVLGSQLDQLRISSSPSDTIDPGVFYDLTVSLEDALQKTREEQDRRRHIVAALNDLYPKNLVRYNGFTYNSATLQFTLDDSRYVVHLKLDGEMELFVFAMDRFVKMYKDEEVMYSESEPLSFTQKPSSPGFAKHLHETLDSRIVNFLKRAMELSSARV